MQTPKTSRLRGKHHTSFARRQIETKTPKTTVFGAYVAWLARLGAAHRAFSYPDYTVGSGVSPDPALLRSRALPPIGNWAAALTLPRKLLYLFSCAKLYLAEISRGEEVVC
ncbi:MAG: hypothetical protein BMS9Abin28_2251 [Anaerolineae bacterium]|nr:MAG: hypothetical protein BMS9Abin28_2251 [Anaerolineae bacterium]